MCGLMTFGRKQWDHLDQTMRSVLPDTHKTMKYLIPMVDADSDAFNQYMVRYLKCFDGREADTAPLDFHLLQIQAIIFFSLKNSNDAKV
jgi:hypothetical protein